MWHRCQVSTHIHECVALEVTGVQSDCADLAFSFSRESDCADFAFSFSRGAVGILEVTTQRRHFKFAVIGNLDADSTYLREDDEHTDSSGPPWLRLFAGLLRLR